MFGQRSNGPEMLVSQSAMLWFLPRNAVLYPFWRNTSANMPALLGICPLYPGYPSPCSTMTPVPAEWWLRPVSNAARVGEQSDVVWKREYRRPIFATRSRFGVGV